MTTNQKLINKNTLNALENLHDRISMLASIQMAIVTHLTDNDKQLMIKIMASVSSQDDFRNEFTQYLKDEGAPDRVKLFMTEINEAIAEIKEEE